MKMIWKLFFTFFQIGLFSIGGGYAIIPLIQAQVVDQYQWLSQQTFTDIITISQMTPGPLAVNTSTFVGIQIAGISGAVAATIGCILAGVILSSLLYRFFQKYQHSSYIFEVLSGLKSASLGLIISAAATILLLTFYHTSTLSELLDKNGTSIVQWIATVNKKAVLLFFLSLFAIRKWRFNPILLMALTGIAGVILGM